MAGGEINLDMGWEVATLPPRIFVRDQGLRCEDRESWLAHAGGVAAKLSMGTFLIDEF